jgi:formate hydrogenlyase subunit 7
MKLGWLFRGLRTGVVTTRYPNSLDGELAGIRGIPDIDVTAGHDTACEKTCAQSCLSGALRYDESSRALELKEKACIMCGLCAKACPHGAVAMSGDVELAVLKQRVRNDLNRLFRRSLHLRHVDAGSCNGCESEIKMLTSPFYDLHRLGIFISTSPRAADGLLITGPVTRAMEAPLRRTYEATADPKLVIATGACACSGGIFAGGSLTHEGAGDVLPVDVTIPGCPPTPIALLHGLLLALGRARQRAGAR